MKEITYKIKDKIGIHARPAGLLVKKASEFKSEISLSLGEKTVDAKKIFGVMSLGAKCGDEIRLAINGSDEETAQKELSAFLEENI
ncbi:MAG: HPr family phosphocarrier protein [Ruminococcaceae bacterium]|nr:HPr family phosphocarrier protein [Oscillospiraceae bacterium]